jgi:NitT/TauT family transport system permease protein
MLLSFIILLLLIVLLWEGVKWLGGNPWRVDNNPFGLEHDPPYRWKIASDLNLPHLWTIAESYSQPSRRNGPPLIDTLISAGLFTFREAITGFLFGTFLGLLLGIIFAHSNLLERGLMPYVVASQTVPILAIAPMVIIWLKAGWVSVAVISSYLTFFPVTINTLRGLRSPDPVALELMRSYAASNWQTLWKLRFPAALPYIFTALKVSATASVVGAIIGELPSGIRDGLGGAILNFNQYYITGPEKLWAAIFITAIVGIAFYLLVTSLERLILGRRQRPIDL